MQDVTFELWQAIAIGFVAGVLVCYFLLRLTKGSVQKQAQTENQLRQARQEIQEQKAQLEKHFAESANLLKTLAQDYQKLYQHLASTSAELLPEQTTKPIFPSLAEHNAPSAVISAVNSDDAPKDYSEGSSGILKAEK